MRIPSRQGGVADPAARLSLAVPTRDDPEWHLTVSPDMARFIGQYARLPGMAAPGGLIAYAAEASTCSAGAVGK